MRRGSAAAAGAPADAEDGRKADIQQDEKRRG
jgi:hypothetical protein